MTINGAVGSSETRITHAHFEGNGATCIEIAGGTLSLDHATFGTTTHQYLSLDTSSFVISRCVFPTSTAPFELVHGTGGIKAGGRGIVRECFFGNTTGYNDIMDFTGGNRPGQQIIQYFNNVFTGGSDDILDLDGTDAWIEGNIFLHVHRNGAPDSSAAISGGDNGGNTSQITIIGNLFFDCDEAATAKQGNFYTLINNTMVHVTKSGGTDSASGVVNVRDLDPGPPTTFGAGLYLEGNLIVDAEQLVRNYVAGETLVMFTNNILPFAWNGPGGGNLVADPRLRHIPQLAETQFTSWEQTQVMRDWFSLRTGSPAIGTGPNGRDLGGAIPFGVSIAGEPVGPTFKNSATLTVGTLLNGSGIPTAGFPEGSGFTHYQWKLDNDAFSAETPITTPITLTNLPNGPHTVAVIGKNDAFYYQNDPALGAAAALTTSRTWTVDTNYSRLLVNEVLVKNISVFPRSTNYPDVIELFNDSATARDLGGLGLSDNATNRHRFTFPPGTTMEAGGFLVLFADSDTNAPGLHTGFTLKQSGDSLFLFDRASNDGALLDSVAFGLQLPDISIGRLADGSWGLTQPTPGSANVPYRTGDARSLKINEWLAEGGIGSSSSFIELFNPDPQPVDLGGLFLTDNPVGAPTRQAIAPLSFIAGNGFTVFKTDNLPARSADLLNFSLPPEQGEIGLLGSFNDQLEEIDVVLYRAQITGISEGRSPSGSSHVVSSNQPTPGGPNPGTLDSGTNVTTQIASLIVMTNFWKFDQAGQDLGTAWRAANYDDSAWASGLALFYHPATENLPAPKNTLLAFTTPAQRTFYYRTHFNFTGNVSAVTVRFSHVIDDGAVFYLNGVEFYRFNMPAGAIHYSDFAAAVISTATLQGPFNVPVPSLLAGDNVLAVEVHQPNPSSSDSVFGLTLDAVQSTTNLVAGNLPIVLNEILARNATLTNAAGLVTDWLELFNPNTNSVDLSGLSLSDDSATPRRWVFPPEATIPAQGFLVVDCDGNAPASDSNTGFGLAAHGGSVFLFDTFARGGALVDAVSYGLQVSDFSSGRIPNGTGRWMLNTPTRDAANAAASLGNSSALKINEWLANPSAGEDWFEIYNPGSQPVDLSGLFLTDDLNNRTQSPIRALSFIGAGTNGYALFQADGAPEKGAAHTNFKLATKGESIGLIAPDGTVIDSVIFGPQVSDVSQGRFLDGSGSIVSFTGSPTPGRANTTTAAPVDTDGDGLPNTWEAAHGLDPHDATDATQDSDGDGLTNLQEFLSGTDPRDAQSNLQIAIAFAPATGQMVLSFDAQPNRGYVIQARESLNQGTWQSLKTFPLLNTTARMDFTDENLSAHGARYYRLVMTAAP